jgi:hypothetical protein
VIQQINALEPNAGGVLAQIVETDVPVAPACG